MNNEADHAEAEWKMDFGEVKALAASLLDGHGWDGRYTVGPSVEMSTDCSTPLHMSAEFTLDDGRTIRILQPSVRWMRDGPEFDRGIIETPSSRARYDFEDIEAVFRQVLGHFAERNSPAVKQAEMLRAEGHHAIWRLVQQDPAVHAVVAHLRAQAHDIGFAHGIAVGEIDAMVKASLEGVMLRSPAWR